MSKSLSRLLYLVSILFGIISVLLLARGYVGSPVVPNGMGTAHLLHPVSAFIGAILGLIASVLSLVAWIGALIRTAQLHRWGWFICLILFSGIAMLFYIFFGPTTPPYARMPMTTPPYSGFGD